jgi:hypothetical protein
MKPEYRKGPKAREDFERTMTSLFRVPKDAVKKPEKAAPKKKANKDSRSDEA